MPRRSHASVALAPVVFATTALQIFWALHGFDHCDVQTILHLPVIPPTDASLQQSIVGHSPPIANAESVAITPGPATPDRSPPDIISKPILDVLSIGSLTRTAYQDAQQATWASSVRNFVRVDERNDTETDCHKLLTSDQVVQIAEHCHSHYTNNSHLDQIRDRFTGGKRLMTKANPVGWVCAQKRPVDGLRIVLELYRNQPLPDYLIIADDDTWINLPMVSAHLLEHFPSHQPTAVAGCRMRWSMKKSHNPDFTIPFGGFGSILTKAALERLMRPIHCDDPDQWVQAVCRRLQDNSIGEQPLFRPGRSVADLMIRYAFDQPHLDVAKWNDVGFCLHSDWNLAFYVNFYGISDGVGVDRLHPYRDSEILFVRRKFWNALAAEGECAHNSDETCGRGAHFCHYVTPEHMRRLHRDHHRV